MSAARPRTGWAQTPPVELIIESNERIVARWREGIRPFMYAWRIGIVAANSSAQTTISPRMPQKFAPAVRDRGRRDLSHLCERPPTLLGREADVVHDPERECEHPEQEQPAEDERRAETRLLGYEPSRQRAGQHSHTRDDLTAAEHGF